MNEVFISTAQNVSIQYTIASLADRIWAHLIDIVIMGVYLFGIIILVSNIMRGVEYNNGFFYTLYVLFLLPILFYHLLFELFNNGQSPGKRALNIRVVKLDGTQLTIVSLLIRWIFRLVDFDFFGGAIALLVIVMNGRGQRLGDIIANTTVVRTRTVINDNVFRFTTQNNENYVPGFPQITTLSESQMLLIRKTYSQARISNNPMLIEKTAETVTDITHIQRPPNFTPQQFLEKVIKDYYYYQNKI